MPLYIDLATWLTLTMFFHTEREDMIQKYKKNQKVFELEIKIETIIFGFQDIVTATRCCPMCVQ